MSKMSFLILKYFWWDGINREILLFSIFEDPQVQNTNLKNDKTAHF